MLTLVPDYTAKDMPPGLPPKVGCVMPLTRAPPLPWCSAASLCRPRRPSVMPLCGTAQVALHLAGCEVAVVREPLQGKSLWWKRAPLELKARPHAPHDAPHEPGTAVYARALLYGEPAFYFYAEQGTACCSSSTASRWSC